MSIVPTKLQSRRLSEGDVDDIAFFNAIANGHEKAKQIPDHKGGYVSTRINTETAKIQFTNDGGKTWTDVKGA